MRRADTSGSPPSRAISARLLADADHYSHLVLSGMSKARISLWIATANVKEMMLAAPIGSVARARGKYISILDTFDGLAASGVDLKLLHGGLPSRAFRAELRRHPRLTRGGLQMRRCPRVHLKLIAIDGRLLYLGSANFTGAGLGAKGDGRRNFEMGIVTDDDVMLDTAQARFQRIWSGKECKGCRLRGVCPKPIDMLDAPRKVLAPARKTAVPARKTAASVRKKA